MIWFKEDCTLLVLLPLSTAVLYIMKFLDKIHRTSIIFWQVVPSYQVVHHWRETGMSLNEIPNNLSLLQQVLGAQEKISNKHSGNQKRLFILHRCWPGSVTSKSWASSSDFTDLYTYVLSSLYTLLPFAILVLIFFWILIFDLYAISPLDDLAGLFPLFDCFFCGH